MHELEAILGVMLSVPDPSVRERFRTLSRDPFARGIMTRLNKNPFGPQGRLAWEGSEGSSPSTLTAEAVYDGNNKAGCAIARVLT